MSQGHKRASSDVSIASSEDEKIPLSPSTLESVPEKAEPGLPAPASPETPQSPEAPEPHALISTSFVEEPVSPAAEEPPEETLNTPEEKKEVSSPQVEHPEKEMQKLEITAEDEKDDDTAEPIADTPTAVQGSEVTPVEEDPYKHLKVTVTLPKEENGEKLADKAKDEKEREPEKNNVDLNLSISSFLSKAKDPASVSVQVINSLHVHVFRK